MATRYTIDRKNLYGKRLYLLGTANFGPVNTPINITSASHAASVFGKEGTLLEAYRVIRETMFDCEVYLVKVTGVHSDLYLNINTPSGEIINNGFYIKAKHANEIYDNIEVVIDTECLYINYNHKSLGDYVMEFKYYMTDEDDNPVYDEDGNLIYKTMLDFAEEINEETRNLNGEVYCYATCEPCVLCNSALIGVNNDRNKLSGGNSGIYYNKNMLYNCLEETYAILEGRDIDLIVPVGAYYDDTLSDENDELLEFYDLDREYLSLKKKDRYLSYYEQLLDFCISQMRFGAITHGIMGMNLINENLIDQDSYFLKLEHFKKVNHSDKSYDKYRQLISVCVGDLYTTHGTRISNSYLAYSALLANLVITENTTNKPLPKSITMFNDFDTRMLNKIRDLGYTAFRYSALKKCVVVANGVTTSDHVSFKYLCNVRMCQLAMCYIRELLSKYIGRNINQLMKTRAIEKDLTGLLNQLVSRKLLIGYGVNGITNPNTGHVMLDLTFRTAFMVEDIRAYSGLAAISKGE